VEYIDEPLPDDDFYLWPEHQVALSVFLACKTQWNFLSTMSATQRTGLNYPGVAVVMDAHSIENKGEILEQVSLMETGALSAFSEELARQLARRK